MLKLTRTKVKANPEHRKQLIAALRARGFEPIGTKSKLFEAFERDYGGAPFTYFVGKDAELRMSRTAWLNDSISVKGLDVYARLLDEGKELLEQA